MTELTGSPSGIGARSDASLQRLAGWRLTHPSVLFGGGSR